MNKHAECVRPSPRPQVAWIDEDDRLWCDPCAGLATRDGVRVTKADPIDAPGRCAECRKRIEWISA